MKKLYKSTLLHLIFVLSIVSFIACQEFKIDSQKWDGPLKMETDARDKYTAIATSPADIIFNISSNTPWSISSDEQWCKVTPAMSSASSLTTEITVTLESNKTLQARTAKLTIEAEGVSENKVITITQDAKGQFEVLPYQGIIPIEGSTIEFGIISNKSWKITTSSQFLGDISKRSGEGNEHGDEEFIQIVIPANAGAKRTGTITVSTELDERSFTVTQDGYYIEVVEQSPIKFNEVGEEKIIKINSNVEWEVVIPEEYKDWIITQKLSDSELEITLKENSRFVSRTGQITITAKDQLPDLNATVEVYQQNIRFNLPTPSDYFIDQEGNMKVTGGNIVSKYSFKKGHLSFEFKELHLTGQGYIMFNMYTANAGDNGNFSYGIAPHVPAQSIFRIGGSLTWQDAINVAYTPEEANAIRKVEFYIEEQKTNPEMINIRLLVDGVEKAVFKDRTNVWKDSEKYPKGITINIQFKGDIPTGDYYILKSASYEPYE